MGAQGEHGGLNRVDEEAMRGDSREQQEGVLVKTKLADEERGDRGRCTTGDQRPSRPEARYGPRAEQGAENAAGVIKSKRERGIGGLQSRGNEKRWQPAEGGVDSEQAKQECAPQGERIAKVIRAEQVEETSLHIGFGRIAKSGSRGGRTLDSFEQRTEFIPAFGETRKKSRRLGQPEH